MSELRQSGFAGSVFGLVNSILGAGIIGVPHAISMSGFPTAMVLLTGFAVMMLYTMELVHLAAVDAWKRGLARSCSYDDLAVAAYGERGRRAVLTLQAVYCTGALTSYIVIIKDSAAIALSGLTNKSYFEEHEKLVALVVCSCLVLPIFSLRSLAQLDRFSFLGILSVATVVAIASWELVSNRSDLCQDCTVDFLKPAASPGVLRALGVFTFAFVCHHNQFPLYAVLKDRTVQRWRQVSRCALVLAGIVTAATGVVVFATFGNKTESDLFDSYGDRGGPAINVARMLIVAALILSYPMQGFVARHTIVRLIQICRRNSAKRGPLANALEPLVGDEENAGITLDPANVTEPYNEPSFVLHMTVTLAVWGFSVGVALSVPTLGDVLNICGGLAGTGLAVVLPCSCALRVLDQTRGKRAMCWAVLLFGLLAGLVTTTSTCLHLAGVSM